MGKYIIKRKNFFFYFLLFWKRNYIAMRNIYILKRVLKYCWDFYLVSLFCYIYFFVNSSATKVWGKFIFNYFLNWISRIFLICNIWVGKRLDFHRRLLETSEFCNERWSRRESKRWTWIYGFLSMSHSLRFLELTR